MPGSLFIISAPSGAGKTSLVNALLGCCPGIDLSISYTTRPPRPGEIEGKDYHFVSRDTFLTMAKRGDFLESAEVYGNLYGTSQSWIGEEILSGHDILLEIDWQGATQVRKKFPDCISIFILPPSLQILEARLKGRGQDSAEVISQRLRAVRDEIAHVAEFDYVIINDKLEVAQQQLNAIVVTAKLRRDKQLVRNQDLIHQLQQ